MCFCAAARSTKPATRLRCRALISGPISTPCLVLRAHFDAAGGRAQVGDELVVDLGTGIDAARRGAVLAGIVETEGAHAADHGFEIGVVEDDHRRLAAELEMRALDALAPRRATLFAGGDIAGQGNHVDARVGDERAPTVSPRP